MNRYLIALQIASLIAGWLVRAAADGKITLPEILELMQQVIGVWNGLTGQPIEIDLPADLVEGLKQQ